ncbi:NADH:flavin oxidoreductase/NADH oxidase [Gulosibacter massiliensis]|uniref:NADH:flavin oxidoreductase/NADH oxidase n=1 Tax=Gulosibacter massiliensis TaxID=2479839 RepID=UPI000F6341D4|nr:NADH:flavin oxidoreductase/NADH oxidase [Gulosibacter massiliensis]
MTHKLFEPLTLRGVTFRNRIWAPPMCQYVVEQHDGVPTPWHLVHLGQFAIGGAGAIIVEATGVVPEGRISPRDLGLWNDEQRDAFTPIVDFVHSQGAKIGIQLAHAGRKASTYGEYDAEGKSGSLSTEDGAWVTVAPSTIAFDGLDTPEALDEAGLAEVKAAFVAAANRALDAGFDFLELHAAHGYLLHSLISPLSNQRTDEYGGSLENRARLLLEIVDAVRAEIADTVPLFVRLSATDWTEGGVTIDETVQLSSWLKEHGVDFIDVSTGGNVLAEIPVGPGYQTPFASRVRAEAGIPTGAVGLINDPLQAEHVLVTGQADVVLIGRELLRNPRLPIQAQEALRFDAGLVPGPYRRAHR